MAAGPKGRRDESPLPWKPRSQGADQFALFCKKYVKTPKGAGARKPFEVRDWQRQLVASLLEDRPKIALWVIARGNGKSTLVAALALHHVIMSGIEGARAVIVAQDERSAGRLLATAARMVELDDELSSRCRVFRDRIEYAPTNSVIVALPGEAHRIEGEDASLAIADELGVMRREAYEALLHSTGKRAESQLLAIGTPSPPSWREASPMLDLVLEGRANDAEDFKLVEFGGDIAHPVDCRHCWAAANPGLGDLVSEDHMRAALPPRSRESEFRRARLAQWVEHDDSSFLPQGLWESANTGELIEDGTEVIVSLDGSYSGDATALLVATVSKTPHVDKVDLWEPPDGQEEYRIPIHEVEDAIRAACRRWKVIEVVCDPFRFARSMQILESEGIPIVEFNQSPSRLTPATRDTLESILAGELTHSGDPDLARHVTNATVIEEARGIRLAKEKRGSKRRIDLAACLIMAHSRATWRASRKKKRRRARSFRA
ncbi:terminase [Nesterenkonia sphaerica]|uniref:Terminase n=1 Tax=Nesterenkonia sphaerica TaxID=1804988 RepID=A0A5R9ABV3_9MICC|nr:terminase [Nesterenkonia sphaerica]